VESCVNALGRQGSEATRVAGHSEEKLERKNWISTQPYLDEIEQDAALEKKGLGLADCTCCLHQKKIKQVDRGPELSGKKVADGRRKRFRGMITKATGKEQCKTGPTTLLTGGPIK